MTFTQLMERALSLSKTSDCIVIGEQQTSSNLRFAGNSLTTNGTATTSEIYIISIQDGRVGVAGQSYVTEENLENLVRRAEAALSKEPSPDARELVRGKPDTGWDQPGKPTDMALFEGVARQLGNGFKKMKAENILLFGFAEHTLATTFLATSTGLRKRHEQATGHIAINAKTTDFKSSVWVGQPTTDFNDISVADMLAHLRQRLEWSKNKLELPAGHYETILEPSAVADMLIYAYWTAIARDADEGRTVFSAPGGTKLGQQLFPESISLYSDPHEPGMEVAPFNLAVRASSESSVFDNGLPLSRTNWVAKGRLQHLITTRHWAKKTNREITPYIHNLIMPSDSTADLEEMIKNTRRGLLVTCLWYIREVDPQTLLLTGLTRDGVFLIENGEVRGAVNNFRFNMSPIDMLANTTEMSKSLPALPREWGDYFNFARIPALRVAQFNMSSISQAQ